MNHPDIIWLHAHGLRLGLMPRLGGGIAAWQKLEDETIINLWRPWSEDNEDAFTLASFPLAPWSNRIGGGGFEHAARFFALGPNRVDQPYPIHGDSWKQAWQLEQHDADHARAFLASRCFDGNPYDYDARQHWHLVPGGLNQSLSVTHRGSTSLPYGLGLHPWILRTNETRLYARVAGVWMSAADLLPIQHMNAWPEDWCLPSGAPTHGSFIDNVFTGWDGLARIVWPDLGWALEMRMLPLLTPKGEVAPMYFHVYRPTTGPAFCIEPVTQPINAFHLKGHPGLVVLETGESLSLNVQWRVYKYAAN